MKCVIVTRQLPGGPVVISTVISTDKFSTSDFDVDQYMRETAEQHVEAVKTKFIEFKRATWRIFPMKISMI